MPTISDDLDVELADLGAKDRLETSMTMQFLRRQLKVETHQYFRSGLGVWQAVSIGFSGFGVLHIAAPDDFPDAGCSIWYRADSKLNHHSVASVLYFLIGDLNSKFLDPDTGVIVEPDPKHLEDFESIDVDDLRAALGVFSGIQSSRIIH